MEDKGLTLAMDDYEPFSRFNQHPARRAKLCQGVVKMHSVQIACKKKTQGLRIPRIALYSHDTMGLGHIRRNLLIAQMLSKSHLKPDVLLISGVQEASHFEMPPGADCLTLPSLYKERNGRYRSRRMHMSLNDLIAQRRKMLQVSISAFEPDVLIVDNVPRGALGELDSTLEYLRQKGNTICVLGLRGVLDEPAVVQREWSQKKHEDAIRRYYDEIWVYGDETVYDTVHEYNYDPDVAAKVSYTGYLDQRMRLAFGSRKNGEDLRASLGLQNGSFVLCLVGGGQDGINLAEAFVEAKLPNGISGVVLTGPYMDEEVRNRLLRQAAKNHRLRVLDFMPEPVALLQHADSVVAMGGYNTLCEIMSFGKPAMIVPRVAPRKEQLILAQRLQELGVIDMVHPDQLEPRMLTEWLKRNVGQPPKDFHNRINMNGLKCVLQLLEALLTKAPYAIPDYKLQVEGL